MNTPDLSAPLRAALLTRLRDNAANTALGSADAVHEGQPASPAFPYLMLGECRFRPLAQEGGEYDFTFSIWSNKPSAEEAQQIAAEIQTHLATPLRGDAFHATGFDVRQIRTNRQSGGKLWRSEISVRLFAQSKS